MRQVSHTGNLLQRHAFLALWLASIGILAVWPGNWEGSIGLFLLGLGYGAAMETRLSDVFLDGDQLVIEHRGNRHRVESHLIRGKLWKSLVFYGCYVIRLGEDTSAGRSILFMPRRDGLFATHADFKRFQEATNTIGMP